MARRFSATTEVAEKVPCTGKSTDAPRNSPVVLIQKHRARFQPFMCQLCAVKGEKAQCSDTTGKIRAVHSSGPKQTCCARFKSSPLLSGSISSSPNCWIFLKPGTRGHSSASAFCVGSPGQPRQSSQPHPWASRPNWFIIYIPDVTHHVLLESSSHKTRSSSQLSYFYQWSLILQETG